MKINLAVLAAVAASGFVAAVAQADTVTFFGTPVSTSTEVRSDNFESRVVAVSADGSYVVGEVAESTGAAIDEFVQHIGSGQGLQILSQSAPIIADDGSGTVVAGPETGMVRTISGNGQVIGGNADFGADDSFVNTFDVKKAATWSTAAATNVAPAQVGLGSLPVNNGPPVFQLPGSNVTGLSNDGSVVIGQSYSTAGGASTVEQFAFRYTAASGYVQLSGLSGNSNLGLVAQSANAQGVSANGNVVVGSSFNSAGLQAVVWTISGAAATPTVTPATLANLGGVNGGSGLMAEANAVSADGKTAVGDSVTASGMDEAVRWTSTDNWATSSIAALPLVPNEASSEASGVSGDGNLIVGNVEFTSFQTQGRDDGFIFNVSTNTMELLSTLIANDGLTSQFAGWGNLNIVGISADGSTLIGEGEAPFPTRNLNEVEQGFAISLNGSAVPEPASLGLLATGAMSLLVRRRRA